MFSKDTDEIEDYILREIDRLGEVLLMIARLTWMPCWSRRIVFGILWKPRR